MTAEHAARRGYLFTAGDLYLTPGALAAVHGTDTKIRDLVLCHLKGDFGHIVAEDIMINLKAIKAGCGRVMSAYQINTHTRVWVITDFMGDAARTTVLLPEEY